MPNRWLLKSEPSVYAWADLVRDKRTVWDGVKNNTALIHIRNVRKGDLAFLYHTGDERRIVGIAKVLSNPYADPKAGDPKLAVFDLAPVEPLREPVTLAVVKSFPQYATFDLVRLGRLSVMPVPELIWHHLCELGGLKPLM